jgi:hypothetical protein
LEIYTASANLIVFLLHFFYNEAQQKRITITEDEIRAELIAFGTKILYKISLPESLPLISKYAKSIVGADRCSMFMYDNDKNRLWATLADGVSEIVIPHDKGIAIR